MAGAVTGAGQRWTVAAAGGGAALLVMTLAFQPTLPLPPEVPAAARKAGLTLIRQDDANRVLHEQAVMHDTTPLFLPTELNAAARELPRREPAKTFLDNDPPKLSIGEAGLNITADLLPIVSLNGKPPGQAKAEDVLAVDPGGGMLVGFGRIETKVTALPLRGGFVEVVATGTGRTVLAETLPAEAAPPTTKAWQPMEFLAAVDPAGLVGPLVITEDSRVEEVNTYFRKYLAQTYRIGERLPPGFYRIIVGP